MNGKRGWGRRGYPRRLAAWGAIVAALWSPIAWPHAGIVKFEPGRRAVLRASPRHISVAFAETIEPAYSSLVLLDAKGKEPPHGKSHVEPNDPKRLLMSIEPLAPGAYTVRYKALSLDGHVVSGEYGFSVGPIR